MSMGRGIGGVMSPPPLRAKKKGMGWPAPFLKAIAKKKGDGHQPIAHGHWHGLRGMVSSPCPLSKEIIENRAEWHLT